MLSRLVSTIKEISKPTLLQLLYGRNQKLSCIGVDLKQNGIRISEITKKITDISNLHWVPEEENVVVGYREQKLLVVRTELPKTS